MEYTDIEYDEALQRLASQPRTDAEFEKHWVRFVCEDLPNFDLFTLGSFLVDLDAEVKHTFFYQGYKEILDDVKEFCFDQDTEEPNDAHKQIVGSTLVKTYRMWRSNGIEDRLFENISTPDSAQSLISMLKFMREDRYLWQYLNYLVGKEVLELDDQDNVITASWNPSKLWPNIDDNELDVVIPEQPDSVPSHHETRPPNHPVSDERYFIHPDAAKRFPLLSGVLNQNLQNPALPTAWALAKMLSGQIARQGKLTRHIALLGPPGVGKTESAKILQHLFAAMGICGNEFVVFSPGKDTEQFVDHMAKEIKDTLVKLKENGGVLLVDEAHKFNEGKGSNGSANFRKRTLDVVFEQVDDLLNSGVIVIFAGYRNEFKQVLSQDAGWDRRLLLIDLDLPSKVQLASSVTYSLAKDGIGLPPNFADHTAWLFDQMIETAGVEFGYWATARNFESALRDSAAGDFLTTGTALVNDITREDFIAAARAIGYINVDVENLDLGNPTEITLDQGTFDAEIARILSTPHDPDLGL